MFPVAALLVHSTQLTVAPIVLPASQGGEVRAGKVETCPCSCLVAGVEAAAQCFEASHPSNSSPELRVDNSRMKTHSFDVGIFG